MVSPRIMKPPSPSELVEHPLHFYVGSEPVLMIPKFSSFSQAPRHRRRALSLVALLFEFRRVPEESLVRLALHPFDQTLLVGTFRMGEQDVGVNKE